MKTGKRILAVIVAFSLCFAIAGHALASGTDLIETAIQEAAYNALPEDAVVCYLMGEPVYKYEIDENRMIHKKTKSTRSVSGQNLDMVGQLTGAHATETIAANMIQSYSGYSDTNSILYLHHDEAIATASNFSQTSYNDSVVVGALGNYGTAVATSSPYFAAVAGIIGYFFLIDLLQREAAASNLYDVCSNGGHAQLAYVSNQYGSFYSVLEWDGVTVYKTGIYSFSTGTINVTSVRCSHGSVWG